MNYDDIINQYSAQMRELSVKYETLRFEDVHGSLLPYLPESTGRTVLDLGCGSGRDAAWFAQHGFAVVAVDGSLEMLDDAKLRHANLNITWQHDRLPDLKKTLRLGFSFDVILLSAIWMHIAPDDRRRVFRKLVTLLRPGGMIAISLRHGPHQAVPSVHPVSVQELEKLAVQRGLVVSHVASAADQLGRTDVSWQTVILHLPDDGTGALPLLRNIIIKDSKSSTYKLALLRTLVRVADSASGLATICDDEMVSVPLGVVALYWIRLFKPLIENGIPQMPAQKDNHGLSFVKTPFNSLRDISPFELRVGAGFDGATGDLLAAAIKDAAQTIRDMPAHYITYPNSSEQVFKVKMQSKRIRSSNGLTITSEFLGSFGQVQIPLAIWHAFTRYSTWIEPSLLFEWSELMQRYAQSHGTDLSINQLMQHLKWLDPERDTNLVRSLVSNLLISGSQVSCVWSGKKLKADKFDIDHCFPFSAWPCNDLWNLVPATREINNKKTDKLVTLSTLNEARARIETWWDSAYFAASLLYEGRFRREAFASLPLFEAGSESRFFDEMFEALSLKRASLKQNLNLEDWEMM